MKILYDHQIFEMQNYGGISRYFYELMNSIKNSNSCDLELSLRYSSNSYLKQNIIFKEKVKEIKKYVDFLPGVEFKGKSKIYKFLRKIGIINYQYGINEDNTINNLRKKNFDIFHPTYYKDYFLDFISNKPFVLTIYDLIAEIYPHYLENEQHLVKAKKRLLEKAIKVIAISENTKKDVINFYGIDEKKIKVIHLGGTLNNINYLCSINDVLLDSIPKRYILFVGNREAYKNFIFFVKSASKLLAKDKNLYIICAGGSNFSKEEIELFGRLKINDRITQIRIDDNILSYLYRNALVFAFPSLYEGFGIPILEAFSCNCPVILSNSSSFPEVAGDAALYFDPEDEDVFLMNLERVVYDEKIRKILITKGRDRLKEFSWDKAMAETLKVYQSAVSY
ncbi:MAG: glycosyltransferase family 4 protein [Candidatus Humimicrobiaceae bacterium]